MSEKDVLGQTLQPTVDVRTLEQVGSVKCDDVMRYVRVEARLFIDPGNRRLVLYFDGKPKTAKDENGGDIKGDRRYYYLSDEQEMQLLILLVKARSQRRSDPVNFIVEQIQNPNLQPPSTEQKPTVPPPTESIQSTVSRNGSTLCPNCGRPVLPWTLREGGRCEWCNTPVRILGR